jgi:RecA-family ATPase
VNESKLDMATRFGISDPEMAARMNEHTAEDEPAPIRTLGDYLDAEIETPPELVTPNFLVRGGITMTYADAGKGKTSLGLHRLLAWAAGKPLFPKVTTWNVPTAPLKSLLIENEGAGGLFQRKIADMVAHPPPHFTREDIEAMRENVLIWGEGGYAGVKVDDPRKLSQVRRGIEEWEPDVVLMEPFARLHKGNENDNSEVNALLDLLEEFASKMGVGIMVAHHKRKAREVEGGDPMDDARGASAGSGGVTYMERVKPAKGGELRELECTKNRYGEQLGPFRMEWYPVSRNGAGWYEFVPGETSLAELLDRLDPHEPQFVKPLAEDVEEPETRVRKLLNEAAKGENPTVRRVSGVGQGFGYLLATPENVPRKGGPEF